MAFVKFLSHDLRIVRLVWIWRLAKSVSKLIVSSRNAVGCGFYQYTSQLRLNFRSKWRDNYFFPFEKTVRIFNLQKKKKAIVFSFTRFKNDLLANLIHLNDSTDTAFL